MNSRDVSTRMKLLFFSFRLILATIQPSRQDSTSTIMEMMSTIRVQPRITAGVTVV